MLKLAILITCHNRREKTLACLSSLFQATLPANHSVDVFLVDDGSNDRTSEAIKKAFTTVHIIQGNGQLYWNRGMHLAWKAAAKMNDFDYYLWLNDDVLLFKVAMVELFKNEAQYTGSIIVGNLKSQISGIATYGGFDTNGKRIIPNGQEQLCQTFNGNFVLIPRQVYQQIGNLDSIFHHAIGDFDYALRAKKSGIQSYITSSFIGFCEKNETLPKWCLPQTSFLQRIKILYSPLGNSHPYYYFIFEHRHYGLLVALKHFTTIHLRVLIPRLWKHQL